MATSGISFQGVTTGLQTDALISAIMSQEGLGVQRLKDRQTQNTQRSTALNTMRTGMNALSISMAKLFDSFSGRAVSSTDSNGTYVTATASGAATGSYEVEVTQIATKGQLKFASASATTPIFADGSGTFSITGTDGVTKPIQITSTNNSLNGLRDAINASGAGVTATVVNSGYAGDSQYQLIITADETGTGARTGDDKGKITLTNTGTTADSLGIGAGASLSSTGTGIAQDAVFSVNGIAMTRQSNTVTDAVDGVTFTLKKGATDPTTTATTLTVAQDKSAISTAMQDVITKFNAVLATYRTNSTVTKDTTDTTGETNILGPLANDNVARSVITTLRSVLHGTPEDLPSSAAYKFMGDMGIKTLADGTLSLDATTFQAALDKDPAAVRNVFKTDSGTGIGQKLQDTISNLTSYSGSIEQARTSITEQNQMLTSRIDAGQLLLDKRKAMLKTQFDKMEAAVAQLRAASSSLSSVV